jgi:hypothetical protein
MGKKMRWPQKFSFYNHCTETGLHAATHACAALAAILELMEMQPSGGPARKWRDRLRVAEKELREARRWVRKGIRARFPEDRE